MIIQIIAAFISSYFFSLIFTAPKKELVYCAITGAFGWFIYMYSYENTVIATFFASIAVSCVSRFLSHIRLAPSTLYLIPGIIPLVPGAGMYYTMTGILNNYMVYSYTKAVETMKLAGVIAIGIIIIFSLPYSIFAINIKNNK